MLSFNVTLQYKVKSDLTSFRHNVSRTTFLEQGLKLLFNASIAALFEILQKQTHKRKLKTYTKPSATVFLPDHTHFSWSLSFTVSQSTLIHNNPDQTSTWPNTFSSSAPNAKPKNLSNRSELCAAADVLVWYQSCRAEQHKAFHLSWEVCQSERQTAGSRGPRASPWALTSLLPLSPSSSSSIPLSLILSSARSIPIWSHSSKDMQGYL